MIPAPLRAEVEARFGAIARARPLGGGIAPAFHLETSHGAFFLKTGTKAAIEAEATGLAALQEAAEGSGLRIPEVLATNEQPSFLLLEWIARGHPDDRSWRRLGEGLAALHRHTAPGNGWGFFEDNFIGAHPQRNGWMQDWPAFFRERRLLPQMEDARRQGLWRRRWDPPAERLLDRLPGLLRSAPERSLLHGDLWGGNHLTDERGVPWLIDPAVYVGDREADLAMTELFGGFAPAFYEAYARAWPLEAGHAERREIYNLYHLLNHLNLFGTGYAAAVERTLLRYGS